MMALVWPCVNSPRWSTVKTEIVNRKKDSRAVVTTLSKSILPTIDPNVSMKNYPGVRDSGVNTNDGPRMAVCQFAVIADAETRDC